MKITMKYHSIQIQSEQDSDIDTLLQDLHQSKKRVISYIKTSNYISMATYANKINRLPKMMKYRFTYLMKLCPRYRQTLQSFRFVMKMNYY